MSGCATGSGRKGKKGSREPIPVKVGDVLKEAKVQSMLGWGAFVDVGAGHRGLLHVDEMKWPEGAMAPSAFDCVKEDQILEVSPQMLVSVLHISMLCVSTVPVDALGFPPQCSSTLLDCYQILPNFAASAITVK